MRQGGSYQKDKQGNIELIGRTKNHPKGNKARPKAKRSTAPSVDKSSSAKSGSVKKGDKS